MSDGSDRSANAQNLTITETTRTTKRAYVPLLQRTVAFQNRDLMRVGHPEARLRRVAKLPAPTLPVDWARSLGFPLEGNDLYGDCMMAAAEHGDNTFTGDSGTESTFDQSATVKAYLALSGGDHGLNTGQILSAWTNGLPGVPPAKIMDSLNIDTSDSQLVQSAIWLFGGVFFHA